MRRLATSWWFVAVALVSLAAGMLWMLHLLSNTTRERAEQQALRAAQIVTTLVVRRNVHDGDFTSGELPVHKAQDMQDDVAALRRCREVLGLEIWRTDGSPLFVDDAHPTNETSLPEAELRRVFSAGPYVVHTEADTRGQETVDLLISYEANDAPDGHLDGVVEVVLPQEMLTRAVAAATLRLQLGAGALLLLAGAGLLFLRRRLVQRSNQARHDALTGLLNRTALVEDGDALLVHATAQRPAALLVLDLDTFKTVNDTLGHEAGDLLLQQVGAALSAGSRRGDVVVRLGGDEFAVLMPDLPSAADAEARALQLLARLQGTTFSVLGVALSVEASIGIAMAPEHGSEVAVLMQRADVAMYQAKRGHRGACLYDPSTDRHDVAELALLVELREAIAQDQLVLHYQPKVALPGLGVTGVEALVRWQHPERGLLPPGAFLPMAEDTGLMQPLTLWVLREATRQAASWMRAGTPLQVAVNISPRSLLDDRLPGIVLAALAEARIPASLLEIEITETAIVSDPDRAVAVLHQLDALGVKVSVDDFGAGFTSLSYLRILPVKALKIDRALVTDMLDRPRDLAITASVIAMGHQLGMTVLAEGIETEAVLRRLTELGCDEAQGYLLSRPLPPAALEGWIAEHDCRLEQVAVIPGAR